MYKWLIRVESLHPECNYMGCTVLVPTTYCWQRSGLRKNKHQMDYWLIWPFWSIDGVDSTPVDFEVQISFGMTAWHLAARPFSLKDGGDEFVIWNSPLCLQVTMSNRRSSTGIVHGFIYSGNNSRRNWFYCSSSFIIFRSIGDTHFQYMTKRENKTKKAMYQYIGIPIFPSWLRLQKLPHTKPLIIYLGLAQELCKRLTRFCFPWNRTRRRE